MLSFFDGINFFCLFQHAFHRIYHGNPDIFELWSPPLLRFGNSSNSKMFAFNVRSGYGTCRRTLHKHFVLNENLEWYFMIRESIKMDAFNSYITFYSLNCAIFVDTSYHGVGPVPLSFFHWTQDFVDVFFNIFRVQHVPEKIPSVSLWEFFWILTAFSTTFKLTISIKTVRVDLMRLC